MDTSSKREYMKIIKRKKNQKDNQWIYFEK